MEYSETMESLKRRTSEKTVVFNNAVRNLTPKKQLRLLNSLSQLEKDLKSSNSLKNDKNDIFEKNTTNYYDEINKFNGNMNYGKSSNDSVVSNSQSLADSIYQSDGLNQIKSNRNLTGTLVIVGKALNATEGSLDLSGREVQQLIGVTALRNILFSQLNIKLTTKQIELIMDHFDPEEHGEIILSDLLGSAKLSYDKWKRNKIKEKRLKKLELSKMGVKEQRHQHSLKLDKEELKSEDLLKHIIDILKEASCNLILSKNIDLINQPRRLILNSTLFKELLVDFNVHLTVKERKVLEAKYSPNKSGNIDFILFKNDFISFGADILIKRRKASALNQFLQALSLSEGKSAPTSVNVNGNEKETVRAIKVLTTSSKNIIPSEGTSYSKKQKFTEKFTNIDLSSELINHNLDDDNDNKKIKKRSIDNDKINHSRINKEKRLEPLSLPPPPESMKIRKNAKLSEKKLKHENSKQQDDTHIRSQNITLVPLPLRGDEKPIDEKILDNDNDTNNGSVNFNNSDNNSSIMKYNKIYENMQNYNKETNRFTNDAILNQKTDVDKKSKSKAQKKKSFFFDNFIKEKRQ